MGPGPTGETMKQNRATSEIKSWQVSGNWSKLSILLGIYIYTYVYSTIFICIYIYIPAQGMFEDDYPFPKVGYVSSLEAM